MPQDTHIIVRVVYVGKEHGFVKLKDGSRVKFPYSHWRFIVPGPKDPQFASKKITKENLKNFLWPRKGDSLIVTVKAYPEGDSKVVVWGHYFQWKKVEQEIATVQQRRNSASTYTK